ncbi:MAG: MmgE/PrpD family protein [Rhizobiaceae bacterium]
MTVSSELASFALGLEADAIAAPVRREALRAFFNWMGCAVGGSGSETTDLALRGARRLGGSGEATVFGRSTSLDMAGAAFVNCISASVDAFDDTDAVMMLHPTSPVASAAFAVAESQGSTGRAFLEALIAGMEIEYRLCKAISAPHARPRRGFYLTGLTAPLGAAAASARLLGLSVSQTVSALAIASVSAAGHQDALSSMCCPFVPSNAARNGVAAAIFAAEGFRGSETAIEGPKGFASLFSEKPDIDVILDGLGSRFELLSLTYKPYPCGIVVHAALDACMEITRLPIFDGNRVERVVARVSPETIELMSRQPEPKDGLQAQVSAHHWIAAVLATGTAGVEHAREASLLDPRIRALRDRVELVGDQSLARHATQVTVWSAGGTTIERTVSHARGSMGNPMSDDELERKFMSYAGDVVGPDIRDLARSCWEIDRLPDVAGIARLAAAPKHEAA